jgi:5-methyltetrahydrofolate--homocysteine methyltransferase
MIDYSQQQTKFHSLTIQRKYKPAIAYVDEMVAAGLNPQQIITEVVAKTLQQLQKFDENPDAAGYSSLTLLAIAKICDDAIKKLVALLPASNEKKETVVIGTPLNDYHGLGKTIVSAILRASGWNVIDLGLSVDAAKFIGAAAEHGAKYILVSAFLLPSALKIKEIADLVKKDSSPNRPKLIVGGPPFKFHFGLASKLGCDGMGVDAFDTVRVLNQFNAPTSSATEKPQRAGWLDRFKKRVFGLKQKEVSA